MASSDTMARANAGDARIALVEVAIGFGTLEIALWSSRTPQLIIGLLAIAFMAVVTLRHAGIDGAGLSLRRATNGWWIPVAACAGAAVMMVIAWQLGTLHIRLRHSPLLHSVLYVVWAFVQEFMLQSFLFTRLIRATGDWRSACFGAATLFSLAHLPNPVLTALTFAVGVVFTLAFRRYRTLYAIGLAHAVLGMAVAASIPDQVTHFMRVGAAY